MNSVTALPTFNLLSIGHRGVGKTVFLAGSYAELHTDSQTLNQHSLWFDCQERQVQENIDDILSHISETGHYPPPTMKITNFSFSLKRRRWWGSETLCDFLWSDIPGEICTIHNRDFRAMVSNSDGCCVFIDAYALVHNTNTYLEYLEEIIKQVMAIASLAYLHDRKYPFVVILTKCDLLESNHLNQQLQQVLQPLTNRLDAVKANYQTFYSLIPIVRIPEKAMFKPKGAVDPLLWLVWELSQAEKLGLMQEHPELVTSLWSNLLHNFQELVEQVLHRRRARAAYQSVEVKQEAVGVTQKQIFNQYLLTSARTRRNVLAMALASVTLVGIGLAYRYTKLTQTCSAQECLIPTSSVLPNSSPPEISNQ